jgi:Ca2+-binding EF-hand superfamily protein
MTNMRKTILAMGFMAAFGMMGTATAAGFMPWTDMRQDIWKTYDTSADGKLSMQEVEAMDHEVGQDFQGFMPWMKDHYAELDVDKDGTVDQEELKAMMTKMKWTDKEMVNRWYKNTGFMPANPAN